MPDLLSRECIDSVDIVGRGVIQHAIDHKRDRFDSAPAYRGWGGAKALKTSPGRERGRSGTFSAQDCVLRRAIALVGPGERKIVGVLRIDLTQGAVVLRFIVAVIRRPTVGGRLGGIDWHLRR